MPPWQPTTYCSYISQTAAANGQTIKCRLCTMQMFRIWTSWTKCHERITCDHVQSRTVVENWCEWLWTHGSHTEERTTKWPTAESSRAVCQVRSWDNEALSQRKQAWVKIKIQEPLFNAKYRDVPDPDKCAGTLTHAWHPPPLQVYVLKKFDDVCELVRVCPVNAISSATNTDF